MLRGAGEILTKAADDCKAIISLRSDSVGGRQPEDQRRPTADPRLPRVRTCAERYQRRVIGPQAGASPTDSPPQT
jgi:hypothetical protein